MGEMGQVCLLGLIQVRKQCPGGCLSHRKSLNAQAFQGIHLKMTQQHTPAALIIKDMGLQGIHRDVKPPP